MLHVTTASGPMNTFGDLYDYCLDKPHVTEEYPFGKDVTVFKVGGKIFALSRPESIPPRINLKCNPERAVQLREQFESITSGYHQNKKHWNTVYLKGDVPPVLIEELIDHSYELVLASLPIRVRNGLLDEGPD